MRTFHYAILVLLLLVSGLTVRAVETPGFAAGSLPEAIVLRRTYVREHPGESAIVLRTDLAQRRVVGACVYTAKGAVHVAAEGADRIVPALAPADLDSLERVRRAVALLPVRPLGANRPSPSILSLAEQLSAVGLTAAPGADSSGAATLRFNWEDDRYAYSPSTGCVLEAASPVAPSELIDCVCFCADYRERHPTEKALLLTAPSLTVGERVRCAAAFTQDGRLGLHLTPLGSRLLPGHSASELANPGRLYHLVSGALATGPIAIRLPDLGEARLDLAQVRTRLDHSGVTAAVNDQVKGAQGRVEPALARVVFDFDGRQFGYSPRTGGYFKGPAPEPVCTSLLDGILFALAYRRDHPSERVVVIPHPPSDRTQPRKVVADTVFSTAGRLQVHSLLAGDFELPGLSVDDLDRRDALEQALRPVFETRMKAGHHSTSGRPALPDLHDPAAIAVRLLQLGQNAGLIPVRLRHEDGRIELRPAQMVRFTWEGVDYLYRNNACFAANRYSPEVL